MLNKHLKGIATPTSVEGEILAEQAVRYRLINETDAAWAAHKAGGGTIKRGAFGEELAADLGLSLNSPLSLPLKEKLQDLLKLFGLSWQAHSVE